MYTSFNIQARNMILYFIDKYFKDTAGLVVPIHPLNIQIDEEQMKKIIIGNNYNEDYKIMSHYVRELGENIPPLVNAYMSLSPTMRMFGTAINYGFGDVEETGILIAVDEILEEKRMRHIESFVKNDPEDCQITSGVNKVFTPKVVTPQEDCSR